MHRSRFKFKICKTKKNMPKLPVIRYMVYMLIATVIFSGTSLSRYSSSSATDDSARVGKFDVSVTHAAWSDGEYNDVYIVSEVGGSTDYVFTVTNNSEVVIRARLIIADSTLSVTLNPVGWFEIPMQSSRDVKATVPGTFEGNNVQMYVEYEQID